MKRILQPRSAWQIIGQFLVLAALLLLNAALKAIGSGDELRTVTTLATVPLGVLHNDNSYTPVASFRGTTYFVWVNSDNRPKVGMIRNGVLSSAYLSPNSAYKIRNDGHHYFSLGVDKDGYLHVTGDMHNYPATDMSYYPPEYQGKAIMYWVSTAPESLSMEFVGGNAARAVPGYGFSYHSFQYDQDRELYFMSRIKVHKGGHKPGEMGLGLYRYDTATRAWTALGGYAPSNPAATYKSLVWEDNGDVDAGGWYQGFRAAHRFDLNNRLHYAASIWNDSTKADPTHVLYGRSDDRGATFKRGDGSSVSAPIRVDAGASQGDIVAGPGAYDLYASVAFNKAGDPLVGYTVNGSPQRFHYRTRPAGQAWTTQVADPFNTYIRVKYQLDANGILTLLTPAGQYRRLNDFTSAGYNGSVGLNNNFVGIDELGLRENNDFIGLSKGSGQVSVVRLRLDPVLAAIPAPWTVGSLGSVSGAKAGRFNGVDSLIGASAGLGGAADSGRYAWQVVSGDVDMKVRVISLAWSADGAQAGLLLRQSGVANAKMAGAVITYGQGAKLISRSADGAAALTATKAGHTAAEWLRLVKSGSTVTAYRSDNGSSWQLIGSQSVALGGSFQAGFFQASGGSAAGTARFDSFSLSTSTPPTAVATASATATRTATPTVTRTATSTATRTATATAIAAVRAPFGGSPAPIPGRIQAEDYDLGGAGLAYADSSPGNTGAAYRQDDVDLQIAADGPDQVNLGWLADGEWLLYSVSAQAGGYYVDLRLASASANPGRLVLSLDGQALATVQAPNTGGWQSWQTLRVGPFSVPATGLGDLRLQVQGSSFNVNWLDFVPVVPATATEVPATATEVPATVTEVPVTATEVPATATEVPATATATATRTWTPVPPTATWTRTSTRTPTRTATPVPSAKVQVLHSTSDPASSSSPHHKLQLKNLGAQALDLSKVELRYWIDCDCGSEGVQAHVDWAGFVANGQTLAASASPSAFSGGGQTHVLKLKFTSGSLASGASAEIQFRFNRGNWGAMTQGDDHSYAAHSALTLWDKVGVYVSGSKAWGIEPGGGGGLTASLKDGARSGEAVPTVLALRIGPNPAKGWALAELDLPASGQARLWAANLAGEPVLSLDLGGQSAGTLRVPLDLQRLADGIYLVRLELLSDSMGRSSAWFKLAVH